MKTEPLKLPTKCAHWGWDDHRYFGYAVFDDLVGHESMIGLSALSVLGRRLSKECCDVLDDIVSTSTLADPRIWPLKITRLVAAYGSIMPAVAAGLIIQEGSRIGPWTIGDAATALVGIHTELANFEQDGALVRGVIERYLETHRVILGFGTPYRSADERLKAFRIRMRRNGRDQLPYWQTMNRVAEAVRSLRRVEPNIAIGMGAAMLDMGVSAVEIGPLMTSLYQHMFFGNAVEGAHQSPAILREIPREYISYVGAARRTSPRASGGVSMLRLREFGTERLAAGKV